MPHPQQLGGHAGPGPGHHAAGADAALAKALDDSEAWVADLASGPARRRVLWLLLKLADHADATGLIWLLLCEDIGAMLDMTFETASQQISRLRREGVISPAPGREALLHRQALLAALQAEDAA